MAEISNTLKSNPRPDLQIQTSIIVPGDKSISHRSMILAGIANGVTKVSGFLESADCLATMRAMQSMGVEIDKIDGQYHVHGVGKYGLKRPENGQIDCGNSGTGMRLLSGIVAAQKFNSEIFGDESLNSRPMARIIKPLKMMGADVNASENDTAPLRFNAVDELNAIHYQSPVASAQVKSCVLLAGLYSSGQVSLTEPKLSRDHTENMLRGFGCELQTQDLTVKMQGGQELTATNIVVPADISSAAFFMVLATLIPHSIVTFKSLCVNSSRTGVISILKLMGADISFTNEVITAGEKIADVVVKSSQLNGIEIPHEYIASAIDEFPIIFIAAALAKGQTTLRNAMELRKKESDRITVMAKGLEVLGIDCHELEDGLVIVGGELQGTGDEVIDAEDDHRCAMSFLIAGQLSKHAIEVCNCENIVTSFPNFLNICHDLGLQIS
ncbi:MAG: 3-phosphoshikimate 1-carboxyvinyltransferase [Alcanivoracaceae bacterium]|nr:3-phosphoshikimate 1-carboxyvinyltransferase [Alcanivoracaceae bacterium]